MEIDKGSKEKYKNETVSVVKTR